MATKQLKSIKFAGLGDTYILPEIDDTLSVEGMAADAKAVGDAIAAIEGGGSGGGGSSVSFDANLNSGTKIGTITIDGEETDIYAPTDTNTTYNNATTSAAGLMSASDKSKLDGITASADSVSFSRSLTSGTKVGTITINGAATDIYAPTDTNTTYSAATTSAAGLMSASDKSKLDGITASADSVSFSRSLTSGTKVGTLTINGTGTDLYAPNPNPSYVKDKTNSNATYLNYGASAVTSASYLAAWNGYELRGITPANAFKTMVSCGSGNYTFTYIQEVDDDGDSGTPMVKKTKTGTMAFTWKKYSDNTFDLFGCSTGVIDVQCGYKWGYLYESGLVDFNIPDLGMSANPYAQITLVGGNGYAFAEGANIVDDKLQTYFCRATSATISETYVQIHMTGKYS